MIEMYIISTAKKIPSLNVIYARPKTRLHVGLDGHVAPHGSAVADAGEEEPLRAKKEIGKDALEILQNFFYEKQFKRRKT